jgi:hypothetical protein
VSVVASTLEASFSVNTVLLATCVINQALVIVFASKISLNRESSFTSAPETTFSINASFSTASLSYLSVFTLVNIILTKIPVPALLTLTSFFLPLVDAFRGVLFVAFLVFRIGCAFTDGSRPPFVSLSVVLEGFPEFFVVTLFFNTFSFEIAFLNFFEEVVVVPGFSSRV